MLAGSQSRRCSIASSTLLVLVLAGCCFCSPTRPLRVGSAENTTGDQKEPKKLLKDYWWANPCAVPGGGDREIAPMSSSEEDEMVEMGIDPNLTDKWAIQLKTAILHIRKIEIRYKEVSFHNSSLEKYLNFFPSIGQVWNFKIFSLNSLFVRLAECIYF